MKTIRVSRIIQILTAIKSVQRYKPGGLARLLGTSRRTVFRDLKILQKAGISCQFDRENRCYTIDPQFSMSQELSELEALGLLIFVHKARENMPFPLKDFALKEKRENTSNTNNQQLSRCLGKADYVIINNGSLKRLHAKIDGFLSKVLSKET